MIKIDLKKFSDEARKVIAKELDIEKGLEELSKDENPEVRKAVAQNPNTSVEILKILSQDNEESVRQEVAQNPNSSLVATVSNSKEEENIQDESEETILAKLSKDKFWYVRWKVAKNVKATPEILRRLARDEHWRTRMEVAQNHNTLKSTIVQLLDDEDEDVRKAALIRFRELSFN